MLWFLAPFFTKRILNAGNALGILCSLLLFFAGIFYPRLLFGIRLFVKTTYGTYLLAAAFCLFLALLVYTLVCALLMLHAQKKSPAGDCTLIVLGCKVYGTRASLMLQERIDAAFLFLESHPQSVCIASGGKGEDEAISEAECIRNALLSFGISPSRIFTDDISENTRQNIEQSKKIIKKQGLPTTTAIVSNEFHIYRALNIAKRNGLTAFAVPARTAWWLFPTYFVRELLCILNDRIRLIK